ncbi:20S proteasome subunit A/B [Halomicrococcus sp. SG-WS-1]|uniref:20S proteasome subunit A/B n=1 Tax=Halomicrococcus sp. SG-WS-1 TaxID=3439057 RepID=UPI003F79C6F4
MGTILGIETTAGVVLAGDRRYTHDGTTASDGVQRVHDFDRAGVAAVGDPGSIRQFASRVESELRSYETEHDESMALDRLTRTTADVAADEGVDAIVAGRTADGNAELREVGNDGGVLVTEATARGSGATVAVGLLESGPDAEELDDVEAFARETMATVANRDAGTGDEVDVYRLPSVDRDDATTGE